MELFKDIKVGDAVYWDQEVRVGFERYAKSFTLPYVVNRVTKTQFLVKRGNKEFRVSKRRGHLVGGISFECFKKEGIDETKEYREFLLKKKNAKNVSLLLSDLAKKCSINKLTKCSSKEIDTIKNNLEEIFKINKRIEK